MPGPGGGSRGGFGGGFGGGPYHRPPRGPRYHWGFYGPRYHYGPRYYGGGGCLGGLAGLIIAPMILILLSAILLFSYFGSAMTAFREGGVVEYDEYAFQDYADEQYAREFGSSSAYEDNLLIVFLTDEECEEFYCIAWVGDHIHPRVSDMFGNETTAFGRAIMSSINQTTYKYSLDSNLARAMIEMQDEVTSLSISSCYMCDEVHTDVKSHLTNKTELPLTEETVNSALTMFTEATGIPVVIVVDEAEAVFGRTMPSQYVFILLVAVALIVFGIYLIVRTVKNRKKDDDDGNNTTTGSSGSRGSYDGGRTDFH